MAHRPDIDDMVRYVKKHALVRYHKPGMGWDYIIECWTDSDLANCIKDAENNRQAVAIMRDVAKALGEHPPVTTALTWADEPEMTRQDDILNSVDRRIDRWIRKQRGNLRYAD